MFQEQIFFSLLDFPVCKTISASFFIIFLTLKQTLPNHILPLSHSFYWILPVDFKCQPSTLFIKLINGADKAGSIDVINNVLG